MMFVLILAVMGMSFAGTAAAAEVEDEQRAEFVPPIMIVNTSFLNVRTGPSTAYPILLTVVGGTELPVLGRARDGVWYQISTLAGIGWVNSEFVIARGDFRNVPVVEAPPLETFDPDLLILTNDLQATGTDVVITGAAAQAATADAPSGRLWGVSVIVTHPSRTQPTINSSSIGTAVENLNTIYPILDAASGDGVIWYRVSIPGLGTVWIEAEKARLRPYACQLSAVQFVTSVAPTTGPDGSGTLTGEFRIEVGNEAYLLDSQAGQFKVELFDGSTGWIAQEAAIIRPEEISQEICSGVVVDAATVTDVTGDQQQRAAAQPVLRSPARVIINTGNLNIRSGPGSQFTRVATVPGGTELDVIGFAPDGVWYLVQGTFGRGWLNSEFTIFRGNGRSIPVIRDASGMLAQPMARVTNAVTLYAAPSTAAGVIGAITGPVELAVVARTSDAAWVQLNTDIGFGWVLASQVSVAGDVTLAPVAAGA
ncbi:MAG: SH3 domain-containing protein [Chloroflexota bacterium]